MVLTAISIIMTVGVYGLVACIVKLDDLGFLLREKKSPLKEIGIILISAAPKLMKVLGVAGTIAMFLVGGGIITHGIPVIHHFAESLSSMSKMGLDFFVGILSGALVAGVLLVFKKMKSKFKK